MKALALLLISSAALAQPSERDLARVVQTSKLKLEREMARELRTRVGFNSLKDFSVDWNSLNCLAAPSSEFEPKPVGTCVVRCGAFQVYAQSAIIVDDENVSSKILYADVD